MNFLFINTGSLQVVFHTKDHFFRAAEKELIYGLIINKAIQFSELLLVDPAKVDRSVRSFPAENMHQVETSHEFILQGFQFFKEDN